MEHTFLYWLFAISILTATLQDLKRREVDNWLTLIILFTSTTYILYHYILPEGILPAIALLLLTTLLSYLLYNDFSALLEKKTKTNKRILITLFEWVIPILLLILTYFNRALSEPFFHAATLLLVMNLVAITFYRGHVFAGGDMKLLFAMTFLFMSVSLVESLTNIGVFLLLLLISGSIYGLLYSGYLYIRNREQIKKLNQTNNDSFKLAYIISIALLIASFWEWTFIIFAIILAILPVLYRFAKTIETVAMTKTIKGSELREGDWLAKDISVKGRTIRANWDGLTKKEIQLLQNKKSVVIREGIPFVPAFLLAFIGYLLLKSWILTLWY